MELPLMPIPVLVYTVELQVRISGESARIQWMQKHKNAESLHRELLAFSCMAVHFFGSSGIQMFPCSNQPL